MNWKLILQLSMFGLVMGVATVFFISSSVEPFCWLVVFVVSAYAIAHAGPGRPFLHALRQRPERSAGLTLQNPATHPERRVGQASRTEGSYA